jgi:hypothetical protein
MKSKLRIAGWFLCIALLGWAILSIAVNKNTTVHLRAEHDALLNASGELEQLKSENAELERLRSDNEEVRKLRLANKDLPKLRNEVRQLRRDAEEAQKIRAENERLTAARQTSNAAQGNSRPVPEGFIPRSAMADVGLSTPEAAVQTFFRAMCNGDIERLEQCSVHGPPVPSDPEELRRRQEELMNEGKDFPGFAIAGKQEISADEVIVQVQTVVGGTVVPIPLKRVGNEWKMAGH